MKHTALACAVLVVAAMSTTFGQKAGTNVAMPRALALASGIAAPSACPNYTRVPIPRGTLTGTVRDTAGREIAGATVRVLNRGYRVYEAMSKSNGNFTIDGVGAGKWDIEISSPYHYASIALGCAVVGDSTTVLAVRLAHKGRGHMGEVLHLSPPPGEKMGTIRSTSFDTWGRPLPAHFQQCFTR